MNDFLHSLRAGKDKHFDRPKKVYPTQNDRRGNQHNRKSNQQGKTAPTEQLAAQMNEALPMMRTLLKDIADNQLRMCEVQEKRAEAEQRKADALEGILESLTKLVLQNAQAESVLQNVVPAAPAAPVIGNAVPSEAERVKIMKTISKLRNDGLSYEKVAKTLEEKGIPTFSGKGRWRGQTVHKLVQKEEEPA